jgi:hypothetical protein
MITQYKQEFEIKQVESPLYQGITITDAGFAHVAGRSSDNEKNLDYPSIITHYYRRAAISPFISHRHVEAEINGLFYPVTVEPLQFSPAEPVACEGSR